MAILTTVICQLWYHLFIFVRWSSSLPDGLRLNGGWSDNSERILVLMASELNMTYIYSSTRATPHA